MADDERKPDRGRNASMVLMTLKIPPSLKSAAESAARDRGMSLSALLRLSVARELALADERASLNYCPHCGRPLVGG